MHERRVARNEEEKTRDDYMKLTIAGYRNIMSELAVTKRENSKLNSKYSTLSDKHKSLKMTQKNFETKKRRMEQVNMRVKRHRFSNEISEPREEAVYKSTEVKKLIADAVSSIGGLSRCTITSDGYHSVNPSYAKILFGFLDWDETKLYIKLFFGVEHSHMNIGIGGQLKPEHCNDFEQIIISLIFLHSFTHRSKLGIIFGVSRRTIARYLAKWLPRWGKIGELLSILPMFPDYFDKEIPDVYRELGFDMVGAMLDGKDALIETIRKNDLLKRSGHSSKMHAQAWRIIVWVTPMGLTFEHTRAMGGRCDENELVRTHSILERTNGPILEWKDYAKNKPKREILKYWTAADAILTYGEVEKKNSTNMLLFCSSIISSNI